MKICKLLSILLIILSSCSSTKKNQMVEQNNISYVVDGHEFKISEPIWWKSINTEAESNTENCKGLLRNLSADRKWKERFKTYFFCGQANKEIPYKLSLIAETVGDYKLAIEIYLGIIEYLKERDPNKPLNGNYEQLGNYFFEIGDLDLARKYYKKAIVLKDKNDPNLNYYASKAKKKLEELSLIEDEEKYLSEMKQFRKTLDEKVKLFNSDSNLVERKKQELKGFLKEKETNKLNISQLAFLEMLKEDFKSKESKVLTADLMKKIREELIDYSEGEITDFEREPYGLTSYPFERNNHWILYFYGKGEEIINVEFNRWKVKDISFISCH